MSIFNTPEWDRKFEFLLDDIQSGRCVVLIGPEIVKIGDRTLRDVMRDHLQKELPNAIAYYYERDGFFLFSNKTEYTKNDVQREVALFYKNLEIGRDVPEDLLLQLIRLPAQVFLSINPDAFLSEVANKYSIKHHFAFFKHGGAGVEEVEAPTSSKPLIYNLCGSLKDFKSLVLDYDDLFSLLKSLLGSPGIPPNLALPIRNAEHFLFIGFDFDKWYSQLLLRILNAEKGARKIAFDTSEISENTSTFLVQQFGIEFIQDEHRFFQELIQRADSAGLLRETSKALQGQEALQILHLVQNGDLLAALNRLKNNPKSADDASGLLSQYHILEKGNAEKTIRSEDYLIGTNRIIQTIQDRLKTDF
ncbi:MAG: SIR2 family protein [Lewinellaceae bacterium]|nr:SIR2 family protein [Lewinellaceae bacterium]